MKVIPICPLEKYSLVFVKYTQPTVIAPTYTYIFRTLYISGNSFRFIRLSSANATKCTTTYATSSTRKSVRQCSVWFISPVPVSYTHLDVYKRQVLSRLQEDQSARYNSPYTDTLYLPFPDQPLDHVSQEHPPYSSLQLSLIHIQMCIRDRSIGNSINLSNTFIPHKT